MEFLGKRASDEEKMNCVFLFEKSSNMKIQINSFVSRIALFSMILFAFSSCGEKNEPETAQEIVDKAIEKAGGEKYDRAVIEFQFRKAFYTSSRKDGLYTFTRTQEDSLGTVKDVLTNEGLKRYRGEAEEKIHDTMATKYAESVNAVHYFVQLPFGLNDAAVQKELLGEDEVKREPYYEVKVTFKQDGGGADHEDEYLYWIHRNNFTVDYLAYRFYVDDGGIRFREAFNPRTIKGIRFADYQNYKTDNLSTPLEQLDELFEAGKLQHVSTIENDIKRVELQ